MTPPDSNRRRIPSIDALMRQTESISIPRLIRKRLIQDRIHQWRTSGEIPQNLDTIIEADLNRFQQNRLQTVINGTGIVLHTNLGRAPLHRDLTDHLSKTALAYSNLEFDLATGKRGKRGLNVEKSLAVLADAESATVVNNCAAALVLMLNTCRSDSRNEVIVSRSELVQIGGGFRVPEILETTGVTLKEVGTTNRTTLEDYAKAISNRTALILKVHQSNFYMDGFVETPSVDALVQLAVKNEIPFGFDLGSGALIDTQSSFGIEPEPTPASIIAHGAHMVCFSGDKLMGGPQAGVIAGSTQWIGKLKSNPFFRALRADKLVLAALEHTVTQHLQAKDNPESPKTPELPSYHLLSQTIEELRTRAEAILGLTALPKEVLRIEETEAEVGGGTMPKTRMPSMALTFCPPGIKPERIAQYFRENDPPIVGYLRNNAFQLNLRTIFPDQESIVIECLKKAWDHFAVSEQNKS